MKEKLKYKEYKEKEEEYNKKVNKIASIRMIIFLIMLTSFIGKYYYYKTFLTISFIISFLNFIICF